MEKNIDLDVVEISDLLGGAHDDVSQVMASSCVGSSVSTSSTSSSS